MGKRAVSFLLAAGLLAAACGQASSTGGTSGGGTKHGGTLRIAIGIDPDVLDPAAQTTTTVQQIIDMMAETLVTIDDRGTVKPLLAEKWEAAPDGLGYTFTLRRGIKFHDGSDFNARAVKFTLDRLLDSKNVLKPQAGILGGKTGIDRVEVIDDTHVKITLKTRLAPFLAALTQSVAAIISPDSVKVEPNTYQSVQRPVGTGPYRFKERVNGDHLTLSANKDYWGTKPNYDEQVFKVVPDGTTREAQLKGGQVDVIALPPANDLPALQHDSNLKVILGPSDRTIQIVINTQDTRQPLLQKVEVRQALNYAVDKDAIISKVMFGAAQPVDAPMAKSLFGYCSVGQYKYDPGKAKSLLQSSGAAGMSVKLISPTGRYVQDIQVAQAVAGYLREVGLKVDGPGTSDWPTYLGGVNVPPDKATTDLHFLGWAPSYLDAQQQMEQFYSQRWPVAGLATSYYKNAQVDSLIEKANSGTDPEQRKKDYCDASKQIWNDAPWIFLFNQKNPVATSAKVTGVFGLPNEKFTTTYAAPA